MNRKDIASEGETASSWVVPDLLIRFVRATHDLNRCEPKHGTALSSQQVRALLYLVHHQDCTIKELAHALSVSEARGSRLADELVEAGHVLHERDVLDRRQVRLRVAASAQEKAQQMHSERSHALRGALAGATEKEIEVFTALLARVVAEFEDLARRAAVEPGRARQETGEPVSSVPTRTAKL